MFSFKTKKMTLPLCLCVMSIFLAPAVTQAETSTGSTAARQAADQKAALAKKAEAQKKAAEEKANQAQTPAIDALKENAAEK